MKEKIPIDKIRTIFIIFLFLTMTFTPVLSINNQKEFSNQEKRLINKSETVDIDFVYSIIQNLSYIIFTEYNESAGELAKGRAFGTKGEHKAAQILYENMTALGLYTTLEKINNTEKYPTLTHGYEVIDRKFVLKNNDKSEKVDCFINAIQIKPPLVHEKIINISFSDIKIKEMPKTPAGWIKALINDKKEGKYLFLSDIRGGLCRNPDPDLPVDIKILRKLVYPVRVPSVGYTYLRRNIENIILEKFFKNCVGKIVYDFTNDTHNTACTANGAILAKILLNGTIGNKIKADINNFTVDFYIKEFFNESVESYNVIGQINGTEGKNTVIVDCLYDSVWSQGTGDSAIGMGLVMGVAKYFKDNNIKPRDNIKFIGFGAEEAGMRGAKYYEDTHKDEKITYIIDLNQVCSIQKDPRLTLNVIFNKYSFMKEIWPIIEKSNYSQRVGDTDITKRIWLMGGPSDDEIFAINRRSEVKTVCFLEDFPWIAHHRDGLNHTDGDVFKYVNWYEVSVLGEILINVVTHLTVETK